MRFWKVSFTEKKGYVRPVPNASDTAAPLFRIKLELFNCALPKVVSTAAVAFAACYKHWVYLAVEDGILVGEIYQLPPDPFLPQPQPLEHAVRQLVTWKSYDEVSKMLVLPRIGEGQAGHQLFVLASRRCAAICLSRSIPLSTLQSSLVRRASLRSHPRRRIGAREGLAVEQHGSDPCARSGARALARDW